MCDIPKKADSTQVSSAVSNVCVTFIPVKFKDIVNEITPTTPMTREYSDIMQAISIVLKKRKKAETKGEEIGKWRKHIPRKKTRGPAGPGCYGIYS